MIKQRTIYGRFDQLEALMKQGFANVKTEIKQEIDRSIDSIGIMVKRGFDHVDERFEGVDRRFDGVDNKLASINRRLSQAVYQPEFNQLEVRVTTLERHVHRRK